MCLAVRLCFWCTFELLPHLVSQRVSTFPEDYVQHGATACRTCRFSKFIIALHRPLLSCSDLRWFLDTSNFSKAKNWQSWRGNSVMLLLLKFNVFSVIWNASINAGGKDSEWMPWLCQDILIDTGDDFTWISLSVLDVANPYGKFCTFVWDTSIIFNAIRLPLVNVVGRCVNRGLFCKWIDSTAGKYCPALSGM